jgi:hypothetical protein
MKENNYKNMIKNLLGEWKSLPLASLNSQLGSNSINNSDLPDFNDSMIREINEVMEDSVFDQGRNNSIIGHLQSASKNKSENQGIVNSISVITPSTNATTTKARNETSKISQGKATDTADHLEEDSMIVELEEFKQDDLGYYTFEIPPKYQISKSVRLDSEDLKKDGKLVKYYNNSVVEIVAKNKTISRVHIYIFLIYFF